MYPLLGYWKNKDAVWGKINKDFTSIRNTNTWLVCVVLERHLYEIEII